MKIKYYFLFCLMLCAPQLHAAQAPGLPMQPNGFPYQATSTIAFKMQNYFRVSNPALYAQLPHYPVEQLQQMQAEFADPGADKKQVAEVFDTTLQMQDAKDKACHKKCMGVGGILCGALLATHLGLLIAARNVECK